MIRYFKCIEKAPSVKSTPRPHLLKYLSVGTIAINGDDIPLVVENRLRWQGAENRDAYLWRIDGEASSDSAGGELSVCVLSSKPRVPDCEKAVDAATSGRECLYLVREAKLIGDMILEWDYTTPSPAMMHAACNHLVRKAVA